MKLSAQDRLRRSTTQGAPPFGEACAESHGNSHPSAPLGMTHSDQRSAQGDTPTIVAFDCGMKRNIIRSFLKRGVTVIRVPWNFDLSKADFHYDGVFISNGPGDPKMCQETIKQIQWTIEKGIPTFGICLGIQLLALAIGGDTYKLKYGHRGANQPCSEIKNKKLKIKNCNGGVCEPG